MRYVKVECTNCLFSVWETEAYLKYLTQCPACESATTTDYELPTRRSWSIVARDGIRCPVCGRRMTGENLAEFYVEDACPACGYVGNSFVYSMRLDAFVCPNCGCVPTAEGHTQDALVRDLDACPQCEFRIRAPTKRQVQSGDYAFNHHYKDGERVRCDRCGGPLQIKLQKRGAILITAPGALKGIAAICNDCGRILCQPCIREVKPAGWPMPKCDACGGSITMPCEPE